jgi:hypothetical protein
MKQFQPAGQADKARDVADIVGGIADYLALIDRSEWRASQKDDRRMSSGGITFVP